MTDLPKNQKLLTWVLQLAVAVILGQTLFFKFTGAEESRALFELFDADPWGRIAAGVGELVAVLCLLIPGLVPLGAVISIGVITPALVLHLTKLGISIDPERLGDPRLEPLAGPSLFLLGVVVFAGSIAILVLRRAEVADLLVRLRNSTSSMRDA